MDGNKHTKGSSTSLVIKEVHIKLAMRCHWIAMPKKKKSPEDTKCWKEGGTTRTLINC